MNGKIMKSEWRNSVSAVILSSLLAGGFAGNLLAEPTEMEVRAAEAEARKAQSDLAEVRAANRLLAKRVQAMAVTADLVSGARKAPPRVCTVEREVMRFAEKPGTLDNRASGKRTIFSKWLNLPSPRRYRVKTFLAISEITGTSNFKFGMMVPRPGESTAWPAAAVGGSPFPEKEISFDFYLPEGAGALFLLGFESGKGVATYRDIRICEITEELK